MYFPYLRAKQHDLAAICELPKNIFKKDLLIPVIEPVAAIQKNQYNKLKELNIPFALVVNPMVGDLSTVEPEKSIIKDLVNDAFKGYKNFWLAFIIQSKTTLSDVQNFIKTYPKHPHIFIHFHKYKDATAITKLIASDSMNQYNLFIDGLVSIDYINRFDISTAYDIIIKDGFVKRKRNEDYPDEDFFFDLHKTYYDELNFDGFGDFTIIGSQYEKGGGPAYVVAIHITDKDENENLIVKHFKSDPSVPPSPINPGGKFRQALKRAKTHLESSPHLETVGINDYLSLYDRSHFPGLGIVKKLSIKHHIEFVYSFIR